MEVVKGTGSGYFSSLRGQLPAVHSVDSFVDLHDITFKLAVGSFVLRSGKAPEAPR